MTSHAFNNGYGINEDIIGVLIINIDIIYFPVPLSSRWGGWGYDIRIGRIYRSLFYIYFILFVGIFATLVPDAKLQLIFLPGFTFTASAAIKVN